MRELPSRRSWSGSPARWAGVLVAVMLTVVGSSRAEAGKLSWLDDVVQEVIRDAKAGGKSVIRGGDGASTSLRASGRLFVHEADEGLEVLAKRSDDLARAGRKVEDVSETLLQKR